MPKRSRSKSRARQALMKKAKAPTIPRPRVMPHGQVVKMRYVDTFTFATGATGLVTNIFRAGSIFDPDVSGVGHQPLAHDQWAAFYAKYRVLSASIKATFSQVQATQACMVGVSLLENSTPLTTGINYAEQPGTDVRMISPITGMNRTSITKKIINGNFDGDISAYVDTVFTAQFGANPTEDNFMHVFVANTAGGASVDCDVMVEIEYTVRIFQRLELAQS